MGPVRSRDSARSKPRGKIHPGMADGEGGPPLSRTDSILGPYFLIAMFPTNFGPSEVC